MKKIVVFFYTIAFVFVFCSYSVIDKRKGVTNFKLKSATTNQWVSLSDYKEAKGFVVVFISNKCPMAKFYSKRLNQIEAKYHKLGFPLVAINSMDTLAYAEESFKQMQKKVKNDQFTFPYLQDKKQVIAKEFKAVHTPQAFVILKNNSKYEIKYEGAIDDNAGEPQKAKNHFLTNALDEILNHQEVTTPKSESFGCRIYFRGEVQKMD